LSDSTDNAAFKTADAIERTCQKPVRIKKERENGKDYAGHMPILMSAGKINLISVPKAKYESPAKD